MAPAAIESLVPTEERLRILVVNDDPEILHSRCAVLDRLGISASPALGVVEAERMSRREGYAAVLIDATNVSYQHAIQLCCAIRKGRPEQKVILLTSSYHVVSDDECPDVVIVRDHPERMLPRIVAAARGEDVPVDDEMAEDPS